MAFRLWQKLREKLKGIFQKLLIGYVDWFFIFFPNPFAQLKCLNQAVMIAARG